MSSDERFNEAVERAVRKIMDNQHPDFKMDEDAVRVIRELAEERLIKLVSHSCQSLKASTNGEVHPHSVDHRNSKGCYHHVKRYESGAIPGVVSDHHLRSDVEAHTDRRL